MLRLLSVLTGLALLLGGAGVAHGSLAAPDVSGDWEWSDVSHLTLPVFVAILSGLEPEGPITNAVCEAHGSMTLFQTDAAFSGVAFAASQQCVTRGGQVFSSPDAGLPKSVAGQITGESLHFSFSNFLITPCPHHAVVSEVEGGVAVALSGGGRCFLPGDPQYAGPLPAPPPGGGGGGTSKTLSWEAVRP
ncbi:MAG: hypothetical protein ACRDNY_02035 [Gaiellaceae bacterium]